LAYTVFRTAPATGSPKTEGDASTKDIRARQIDELVRQSESARKEVYGVNWDEDCANVYNLVERSRKMPSFRPRIAAPQLQLLLLQEAADATDTNMRVFIHKEEGRDKQREKAFQEHWKQEFFNLQFLMGQIYAQFAGTAWIQAGNNPLARRGKGNVWLRARLPKSVHVDPISPWPDDWTWQIFEDFVYLDTIKKEMPDHAENIKRASARSENLAGGAAAGTLEMPPGPMSVTMRGLPSGDQATTDGPMKRRTCYSLDTTMRDLKREEEREFVKRKLPVPDQVPKYPNGRMIVECEGTILADGDSWCPLPEMWPAYPIWSVPPWDTVWCPPPMKYTKSLQDAAEQQMTMNYENARRLNNGIMIIHASTGLTANTVGGLPGEVLVAAANSQPGAGIDIKYPPPFASQQMDYPMKLLGLQKELRGATPARQGNLNPGNVGPDLFEAAVSQSQAGTRLTARLFAWTVQRVAELLFFTMCKSYTDERIFRDKDKVIKWQPDSAAEEFEIQVPEGAVRPLSQASLRSMVIELRKAGMMTVKHGLEMLDVPEYEEVAEAIEKEQAMAALAKGIKK